MLKSFPGDPRILFAARVEARSKFNSNRSLSPESLDAEQKILEAQEVARILRQNVVQGHPVSGSEDAEQRYREWITCPRFTLLDMERMAAIFWPNC